MTNHRATVAPLRALLCAALAVAASAGAALSFVRAAGAEVAGTPMNLHVDAQEYAATAPADPYQHDAAAIHVSVAGGQDTTRSYVHVDLAGLVGGAMPTSVLLSLTPNGDAAANANGSAATLQACPLLGSLEPFNPTSPPGFDCTSAAHGTPAAAGTWTFELAPLMQRWLLETNRGVAIVADHSAATATWFTAFDRSKTRAIAVVPVSDSPPLSTYTFPAVPAAPPPAPPPAAVAPPFLSVPATTPGPPSAATPGPSPSPSSAASAAGGAGTGTPPAPGAATMHVEPASTWLWWLLGSVLLGAAAALAMVVQRAVRDAHRLPDAAALRAALRHPDLRLSRAGALVMIGAVVAVGFSNRLAVQGSPAAAGSSGPQAAAGATPSSGAAGGGNTGATAPPPGAASGPAAAQSAAAAAQSAAAAAAAAGAQAPTGDIPGVTATTIRIGFMTETNRSAGNGAIGAKNIGDYGNVPAQAQAMADWLNRNGGIAGRRVIPVMENFDASNTDPNQEAALCTKFTQDDHVFSVVDIESNLDYGACYAHAHTLVVEAQTYQGDTQLMDHLAPYVFDSTTPPNERAFQVHADGLAQQGFFGKTDKVGIIVADDPLIRRDFTEVAMPRLARAGVTNPDLYYVNPYSDTGTKARDLGTAVTRMHSNGDTEVMLFGDSGGGATLITMAAAKGQGWYPKWGLDTSSAPGALETISQISDEMKTAVVVGYNRTYDAESDRGGEPVPASPLEKLCVDTYRAAGISFATRLNSVVAYRYCDYAFLLHQASQGLGANLSIQTLMAQAWHLGSSYMSVNAYHATFNGRPYGTDGYRMLGYDTGCSCFKYSSPTYTF
ncbi:MAG TPA: hypothetical protein VGQ42_15360 [Candidatus Dormibacteraeota bacterium]|nr:hypothetical protein [Candidatus Dormibacteraeota bacterium]